jgi:hypothetical protein
MTKRKAIFSSLTLVVFLTTILTFNMNITSVKAPEVPLVYIDPPQILDLPVSTTFKIMVKIANVTNLYGFDIQLKWDKTILSYVNHTVKVPRDTYPDGVLYKPYWELANIVDENNSIPGAEPGAMAWFGYASASPASSFNGSGIAVEMFLHVKSVGSCWIEIVSSALSDKSGFPISHNKQNAYFSNPPPPTKVKILISPKSIVDATITPCNNISIDVKVFNVIELFTFEFWINYNTLILDVNSVQTYEPFTITDIEISEDLGKIRINATVGPIPTGNTGDLTLATVKFHVTDVGESILDLNNVLLVDKYERTIPTYEPEDGYFNNQLISRMFISPPELIAPNMKPSDIFTIEVKIENVIDMYDYEYKLSYDTTVLTCLGATVIPPDNQTEFTMEMDINDTKGLIWVKVQYYSPANPISIYTAKTVTIITFMVQSYGQTVLDLHDTRISDPQGNSLSHEVEDGFFATLLRDVAILNVNVTSSNTVYPGRIVTIEVIAMNRGNMTTEAFHVTLYYNSTPIETKPVLLGPWSNTTLIFHWDTSGLAPCSNFTIWAEASLVPYEINTENNVFYDGWVKIKYLGDVNGDGRVDVYDACILLACYGTREGDPNYEPEADMAPRWGIIDLYDAVTLLAHYGQGC